MIHLAVDIGNTNIVFGIYDSGLWTKVVRIDTASATVQSIIELLKKELSEAIADVSRTTVSSVVPEVTNRVMESLDYLFGQTPFLVHPEVYQQLDIDIPNPGEIGTDLVSNAVAATRNFGPYCIVADFGTALTFTVIERKKIIGVNILPGIRTSLRALVGNASQLTDIPLELTPSVIGKDTKTAIQSGILWGYVGLVERMLDRIELELGTPSKKIATGGLSLILPPLQTRFDSIDQNLTLEGIRLIGEVGGG